MATQIPPPVSAPTDQSRTRDYVFVSDSLADQVKALAVNMNTQASDHQPLLLALG